VGIGFKRLSFALSLTVVMGVSAGDAPDPQITAQEAAAVIEGSIQKLQQFYVFPQAAKDMGSALRLRTRRGEYRSVANGSDLATKLTDDLRAVSHDKHLRVEYFKEGSPPEPSHAGPAAEEREAWRASEARENFGFAKVERLEGNIGYLELHAVYAAEDAAQTTAAAMTFLTHTGALILDLRRCLGGDPTGLIFTLSYFFDEPTHVDDMKVRWPQESVQQLWTMPAVPGLRFGGHKPIYVLTSRQTFSGCEALVYDLKAQQRARVVGERTAGAAHLTVPLPVSKHFRIAVPFGRSINPVTQTDWEGTGVQPDLSAPADQALEVAHQLALQKTQG
jgi:hypothetical protein